MTSGNECDIAPIIDKMRKDRLQWYGNILRTNDNMLAQKGLQLEVNCKQSKGQLKPCRLNTLHSVLNMKILHLHSDQVQN